MLARFLFFVLILAMSSDALRGQWAIPTSNSVNGMPTSVQAYNPKNGPTMGLMARIYPPFSMGPGYLDWGVEIQRVDGKVFDHDEEIVFQIYNNYQPEGTCTEKRILMKQGMRFAREEFQSATFSQSYNWCAAFKVNGRVLKGLSSNGNGRWYNQGNFSNDRLIVFCDKDFDKASYLEEHVGQYTTLFKDYENCFQWSVPIAPGNNANANTNPVNVTESARLSDNWLQLARFTSIILPVEAISQLKPGQIAALRSYIHSGGTAIVSRCKELENGSNTLVYEGQDEIYRQLSGMEPSTSRWETGMGGRNGKKGATLPIYSEVGMGILELVDVEKLGDRTSLYSTATNPTPPVVLNTAGMGMASTPVNSANPRNVAPKTMASISRLSDRGSWNSLRGTNQGVSAGSNFWNWMIPGIGKPPIWAFASFIILFAGIAGPVLAYVTIRARRPAWLIILFPIIAALVTMILSGYAIFHDGFRTFSRTRSFTWYDLKNDRGFAWSRQTLFSGSPPSEGLKFRSDAEVTPLCWKNEFENYRATTVYVQKWSGESQSFVGLLPHREQRQFLVRHPVEGLKPLRIQSGETLSATNHTNESFPFLIVTDQEGKLHTAKEIGPKSTVSMDSMDVGEAQDFVFKLLQAQSLELPTGLIQGQQVSIMDWMNNRSSLSAWNSVSPLMESQLSEWCESVATIPKSSFILFLKTAEHVDRPVKSIESDSFHVMVGPW